VKLSPHLRLVPGSKDAWSYTSLPQYAFMVCCSIKKHMDNFTLSLRRSLSKMARERHFESAQGLCNFLSSQRPVCPWGTGRSSCTGDWTVILYHSTASTAENTRVPSLCPTPICGVVLCQTDNFTMKFSPCFVTL
jgi:hypothetical protein